MNKRLFLIAALTSVAFLAGCEATAPKHGKFDETEYFPDG